ncbi:hypothetical protein A2U01_0092746, partial [Trifolium medium]|nr:hypothetical protein [Trifolium medium]
FLGSFWPWRGAQGCWRGAQARLQEAGLALAIAQRVALDGATRGVACRCGFGHCRLRGAQRGWRGARARCLFIS